MDVPPIRTRDAGRVLIAASLGGADNRCRDVGRCEEDGRRHEAIKDSEGVDAVQPVAVRTWPETSGLENRCGPFGPPRVRIPPSPPQSPPSTLESGLAAIWAPLGRR